MKSKPIIIRLRNVSHTPLTAEEEVHLRNAEDAIYFRGIFYALTKKEKTYLKAKLGIVTNKLSSVSKSWEAHLKDMANRPGQPLACQS